jgi:hypothetical protein
MKTFIGLALIQQLLCPVQASPSIEVVLAHHSEDLSWIAQYGRDVRFRIYTKGVELRPPPGAKIHKIEVLPNVGRESHTYISHIVKNYHTLADWTVFTQAGQPSFGYKGHRSGGGHLMAGDSFAKYLIPHPSGARFVHTASVHLPSLDHLLRASYCIDSELIETGSTNMCPAEDSQWTPWWENDGFRNYVDGKRKSQNGEKIMDFYHKYIDPSHTKDEVITFFPQGARFAVSRDIIHRRPKSDYERLLATLSHDKDPYSGYYMEWLWSELFLGHQETCSIPARGQLVTHAAAMDTLKERFPSVVSARKLADAWGSGTGGGDTTTTTVPQATTTPVPATTTEAPTPAPTPTCGGDAGGAVCIFPFDYGGKEYTECTIMHNGNMPWCNTVNGKWGNCKCDSTTTTAAGGTTAVTTATTTPAPTPSPTPTCGGTADGAPCIFPFHYGGIEYDACTTKDSGNMPWCNTVNAGWGNCRCDTTTHAPVTIKTTGGTGNGAICLLPFVYGGTTYTECTTIHTDNTPWCNTVNGGWGLCVIQTTTTAVTSPPTTPAPTPTCGGTADGAMCLFPFHYGGTTYTECTTINNGNIPWCNTVNSKWGECKCDSTTPAPTIPTTGGTGNGAICLLPFVYGGTTYTECTTIHTDNTPWCNTVNGGWGLCVINRLYSEEKPLSAVTWAAPLVFCALIACIATFTLVRQRARADTRYMRVNVDIADESIHRQDALLTEVGTDIDALE